MMETDINDGILAEILADSGSESDDEVMDDDDDDDVELEEPTYQGDSRPRSRRTTGKLDFRSGWERRDHYECGTVQFTGNSGPTGDFATLSAVEIFKLYFCQLVWNMLVDETNRYAQQTIESIPDEQLSWHPTNIPEMMAFVALLIAMGINKSSQYKMYWSTSEILHIPFYPSIMSRNRFSSILRFLHISNNQIPRRALAKRDKLSKVRPLIEVLVQKFLNLYNPAQNLSPDESMLKFKGRLSFVQYMPNKPIKRGIKAFSLNESKTGYTCAWKLYTGADDTQTVCDADVDFNSSDCHPPNPTVAGKVVIDLVHGLENKGHVIYCDNYYTSPALVAKLAKLGFGCCGTVRYTTQGIPQAANPKNHKMKKGDDPFFLVKGGQLCIVWQDKKSVTLLTNVGNTDLSKKQIRCNKSTSGFCDVMKPNCIEDYNKNMGGTDLANQCFQYYNHTHRSLKWWKRVFFHMLNICIVNSRVIFTSIAGNKNVSNLDFRIGIVQGLLLGWERNATSQLRYHIPIELTGQQHYPGKNPNGKKRDCIVCSNRKLGRRKQTKMICKQCTQPMCIVPCFEKYHIN